MTNLGRSRDPNLPSSGFDCFRLRRLEGRMRISGYLGPENTGNIPRQLRLGARR